MKCVSIVILCALLLVGLAVAGGGAAVNDSYSSGKSELNVTLLDFGPVGDHGWTYEAHAGASKMAQKQSFVNLSERECSRF